MISFKIFNKLYINLLSKPILLTSGKSCQLQLVTQHRKISHDKTSETKKIKFFLVDRYMIHLKRYEKFMYEKFPNAMGRYRSFMDGIKIFIKEVRLYYNIVGLIGRREKTIANLSRQEIELYDKLPKDMLKLAPVLFFSALPFANYVIFPLIYFFPKQLLSSHFWTLQQKNEFHRAFLNDRTKHNIPIMLQLYKSIEDQRDDKNFELLRTFLKGVENEKKPTASQILELRSFFSGRPYNLSYLREKHIKHLLSLHNLHTFYWFRRQRLLEKAMILKEMDMAILREGGLEKLSSDELKSCCYVRGINIVDKQDSDIIYSLSQWIAVSREIDPLSVSLLLHCPLFLSYKKNTY